MIEEGRGGGIGAEIEEGTGEGAGAEIGRGEEIEKKEERVLVAAGLRRRGTGVEDTRGWRSLYIQRECLEYLAHSVVTLSSNS